MPLFRVSKTHLPKVREKIIEKVHQSREKKVLLGEDSLTELGQVPQESFETELETKTYIVVVNLFRWSRMNSPLS